MRSFFGVRQNCTVLLMCLLCLAFPAQALKIVSLSPAVTELVFLLGKGEKLIGRSRVCNYPAAVGKIPIMGDFARPDAAKILAAKPDVVITNDLIVPSAAKTFERYGIKVLFLPCRSVSDYCKMVDLLGKELDSQKAASAELERVAVFLNQCRKWKKLDFRVLCLIWHHPVVASGKNTFTDELIKLAGAENCVTDRTSGFFKPSADFLFRSNADTLLIFDDPSPYTGHPVLKHLPAVKKKRIVCFPDTDLLQRPGPRFTDGVILLRKMLEK